MTADCSLLAALAAVLSPGRRAALRRGASPDCAADAERLAALPSAERLAALGAALAALPCPSARDRDAAAAVEPPRLAALIQAGEAGQRGAPPLLRRLIRERLAQPIT